MGLVADKLAAIEVEIAAITARLAGNSAYVSEYEFGSARKRAMLADGRRARDEERLRILETQKSQLSVTFGGRSKVIRSAV